MTSSALDDRSVSVGYSCPCGCTPAVIYHRDGAAVTEGCCCGNELAVGPDASSHLNRREGFQLQTDSVPAHWCDLVPVAWAIGPSTHPDEPHEHADSSSKSEAIDPVCGMVVIPADATAKGLHVAQEGIDYYFCSKGCKLDFGEDPARYLDPSYVPVM
jgi:YHS domain-containing protein